MTKKFETRGGARQKKRLYSSQSRFLQVLWLQHGGVTICAEKIGVSRQLLINWKLDGCVPLEWCGAVSRALEVPIDALNHEGIKDLTGSVVPWKTLVGSHIDKERQEYVLNGNY